MLRLLTAAIAALMMLALPALAGDRASLNVLGYSEDGRYFAFEEVGEYDLVEGYFDRIFVLDLSDDSWVKSTPFVVDIDKDGEGLSFTEVHAKLMSEAEPVLQQLKITAPAKIETMLPDGLVKDDGTLLVVNYPSCCAGPDGIDPSLSYKLMLKTFPAKIDETCNQDNILGFELTDVEGDGQTFVVHKDGNTVPKTRDCPQQYRLYAVVSPAVDMSAPSVAIISYYFYEDEGLSRRFIAVPLRAWEPPSQ